MAVRVRFALGLLSALAGLAGVSQKTRADGVEFQPVPIDVNKRCSSLVLEGTSRFAGTAFVVPKVFISINKAHDRLFEILPAKNGDYTLRIGLYIPSDPTEALSMRPGTSELFTHGCDLNDLRTALTREAAQQAQGNADGTKPILRLTPLPIQQLTVHINGIDQAFQIGSAHTDILDYFGLDQIAEFTIHGKDQLDSILSRIRGDIGLGITVDMGFGARSSSSYLNIKVDTTKIAADLQAKFGGQISVAHADLAAAVSDSLRSMNLSVYQEGDSDVYGQLAQSLISQLGKDVFGAAPAPAPTDTGKDKNKNKGSNSGDDDNDDGKGNGKSGSGSGGDGSAPAADLAAAPSGTAPYNVAAAVKFLHDKQTLSLVYQKMGAVEQKVFTTSTILQADLTDVDSHAVGVSSEKGWFQTPISISQGQQVVLTVDNRNQTAMTQSLATHWYSKSALEEHLAEIASAFPILDSIDMNDVTEVEGSDGAIAQYIDTPPWYDRLLPTAYVPGYATRKVKWGYKEWSVSYSGELTQAPFVIDADSVQALPLEFSFTGIGSRIFKASDLIGDNGYFEGLLDANGGRIVLRAEQDLGYLKLHNAEPIPSTPHVLKEYLESSDFSGVLHCWTCSIRTDVVKAPEQAVADYQSEYVLKVRAGDGEVRLTPKPSSSARKPIVVP